MDTVIKKFFALKAVIYKNKEQPLIYRWFIALKMPNYITGDWLWRKCYGNINKFHTVPERLAEVERLTKQIENAGFYIPDQGARIIRPATLKPQRIAGIIYQLTRLLDLRKYRLRVSSFKKYEGLIENLSTWLLDNGLNKIGPRLLYRRTCGRIPGTVFSSRVQFAPEFVKIFV